MDVRDKYQYDDSDITRPLIYIKGTLSHTLAGQDRAGCLSSSRGIAAKAKHNGNSVSVARLVWMFFNGNIPDGYQVDHINSDIFDNRIENLQILTPDENKRLGANSLYSNNSSGMTGVLFDTRLNKWKVSFKWEKILYYFGVFDDIDEAKSVCKCRRGEICSGSRR